MTSLDILCLTPLIILAIAPVILMLAVTVSRNLKFTYIFSLVMFLLAFASLFVIMPYAPHEYSSIMVLDSYGVLFLGIIYVAAILITVLSYEYLRLQAGEREEYFIILFVAMTGASVLIMAEHFVTFFLGLETLSISLFVMIAFLKWRDYSIEAGIKFLVVASLSSSFLLFGMGLIYAGSGSMSFASIMPEAGKGMTTLMLAGVGLMLAGIGFKLALVPFHMWTPDIYQGAPAPVTTFIATVSKGAVLALALRLFIKINGADNNILAGIISAISILSMFTGNLLALRQSSVKRMLAYSSIAQLGYILITLVTGTADGTKAAVFYLAAYVITTLGAFGVISILSFCERDADNITDMKGLFWSNPWIATVLTAAMLSLAGIPLTAGFMSKFFLVVAGVRSGLWLLAFSLIINSAISLYYYLRVVKTMFESSGYKPSFRLPLMVNIVLLIIFTGILFIGILPSFLTELISSFSSVN